MPVVRIAVGKRGTRVAAFQASTGPTRPWRCQRNIKAAIERIANPNGMAVQEKNFRVPKTVKTDETTAQPNIKSLSDLRLGPAATAPSDAMRNVTPNKLAMPMSWGNDAEKLFMRAAIIPKKPHNKGSLCHAFHGRTQQQSIKTHRIAPKRLFFGAPLGRVMEAADRRQFFGKFGE